MPHYDTEAEAMRGTGEEDRENDGCSPTADDEARSSLTPRCWVVQCDGECEMVIDTEDEGCDHPPRLARDAEETADGVRLARLEVTGACSARRTRREARYRPPPSPAELEAAGQLRLPGVLPWRDSQRRTRRTPVPAPWTWLSR